MQLLQDWKRKGNFDSSNLRLLSIALASTSSLAACGGGTTVSIEQVEPQVLDNEVVSETDSVIGSDFVEVSSDAEQEVSEQVDVISNNEPIGNAPILTGIPVELSAGVSEIGTIYIDDEAPDTVEIQLVVNSEHELELSADNVLAFSNGDIAENGDLIQVTVIATDEQGLQTVVAYDINVSSNEESLENLVLSYTRVSGNEIQIDINIASTSIAAGDGVEGMQFDLEFDPAVFSFTPGDFAKKNFMIEAVNSNMADQGLIRVAVASIEPQDVTSSSLVNLTLDLKENSFNSLLEFTNIRVDDAQLGDTQLSIIA